MTLRPEPEIQEIRRHIETLRQSPQLSSARQWWPACLFHCTDVTNAVNILRQGELLSRTQTEQTGQLKVDIASKEVIAQTATLWKDYVRLYFRPRTPTQYNNEGFRPVGQQALSSHCPVPTYLIFDALTVLSRVDCQFSDGNLGSAHTTVSGDVTYLKQIPFDLVYHDTWFDISARDSIIHHRNAEVLVPQRMGLENIRLIVCRTNAEYETLLHLLPPRILSLWRDKIGVRPDLNLFNRLWTFVERAELSTEKSVFRFNPGTKTPGPFSARAEITETATGLRYTWQSDQHKYNSVITLHLNQMRNPLDYTVHFFLDDHLAYANRYQADDLPF